MHNTSEIFEQIAKAVADKYLAQVKIMSAKLGARPSFDELMQQLKKMEHELTKEGISYLESLKQDKDCDMEIATGDIKNIIRGTVEGFVKQL